MTAQVEEVTASAQSLAELAETLQQAVAQFKLGDEEVVEKKVDGEGSNSLESAYYGPDRRRSLADQVTQAVPDNGQKVKVMN
jgi:hypothetical protein